MSLVYGDYSVIKEYRQKVGTLKRNQQTEKKKNAQLLEEARKREDTFTDDASQLSVSIMTNLSPCSYFLVYILAKITRRMFVALILDVLTYVF